MNRPIRTLAVGCLVLFVALLVNISYVQYWQADHHLDSLTAHPDNYRVRDELFSRERGAIVVDGKAVAESNKSKDAYKYQRYYPEAQEYAPLTGFFSRDYGVGGVEASQNAILSGSSSSLFVNRVVDLVDNQSPRGGSVTLTIDAAAQKAAYDGLRKLGKNTRGAVVAIQPNTGKILAMASTPTYNPNKLASHDFSSVGTYKNKLLDNKLDPLSNRAIETVLPPGSTFKLVTAAAALSSGKYKTDSMVPGGTTLKLPQTKNVLPNENHESCGGAKITLTQALMVSCNVAFGSIGLKLGDKALRAQAEKFGFGQTYFTDLDDPLTRQAVSVFPKTAAGPLAAYSAIGQYDVAATPLQMAMVAAGIANGGRVMKPYLVDEIQSPDLDVISKTSPEELSQATSSTVARDITEMMVAVVDKGTGTAAQIPKVQVAGKTGTAQSAKNRPPYAWFVSFAPASSPKVAVAVLVQDAGVERNAISGNGLAAPIAKAVMQAVLDK